MGRAPCCEKMGLKKGPWTAEEDQILINYINTSGHANWRALPKQAGLLRCGKSCRLRWINYLRPDIKRGNFTTEEEETIINLHQILGNRWSAIAAKLPGRTDNEIKNVWHTHFKKRLQQNQQNHDTKRKPKQDEKVDLDSSSSESNQDAKHHPEISQNSGPHECSSDDNSNMSSSNIHDMSVINNIDDVDSSENSLALDEDFWSEVLSADNSGGETTSTSDYLPASNDADQQFQFSFSPLVTEQGEHLASSSNRCDGMDFWYDVYARADELNELLQL